MSTVGREVIGKCRQDMLIADNKHPLDICHVKIAAGKEHKRGEVLEIMDNGSCDIRGTDGSGTAVAAYILAEDVDATDEETVAAAYRSGSFIRNALLVKEGYSLTQKDEETLRNGGIYLTDAIL